MHDDEVNEMRTFVRMFMDLVGIFNDDHDFPDEGKLSGGNINKISISLINIYICIFMYIRCFFWYDVW